MLILANGCTCSDLIIYPSNWKTGGASLLKKTWYIQYYFYDPLFLEQYPKGKEVKLKGFAKYKTLEQRRAAIAHVLDKTLALLKQHAYNPMTKQKAAPVVELPSPADQYEIDPETPWLDAIKKACDRLKVECIDDMKSCAKFVSIAAHQLRYETIAIKDIRRKHIKICLEHLQATRPLEPVKPGRKPITWGAASFNRYRGYLGSIFKELLALDAIESNPISDLPKQDELPEARQVLTDEERPRVDAFLKANYYTFWRYMQIFFHSGCRTTEMLLLQAKSVDLVKQTFTMVIKKGKKKTRATRTIKNIALPLWKELLAGAAPEDYIFSRDLKPGAAAINPDQIKRRWREHVKKKLEITADFYSLKHLHSDQVAAELGIEAAAAHDGHTSTAMVRKIYAVGEKQREHERVKKLGNSF